jgi:DNA-directed RNA polymerase subunit RPC12/RpoP
MNEQRAVIQQMVDALDHADELLGGNDTLVMNGAAAGRWLLEQPAVQEPVASYCCHSCFKLDGGFMLDRMILCPECGNKRCPKASDHQLDCTGSNEPNQPGSVYTTPPAAQKPWVGLTDEEIHETEGYEETREMYRFALAIEAKLKEKNHG